MAIEELTKLKAEGQSADGFIGNRAALDSWKARVRLVLVRALGNDNNLIPSLDEVRYLIPYTIGNTPRADFDNAGRSGVRNAIGLLDAAVYELGFIGGDEPVDEHAFDPELWAHVKTEVEDGEWGKVASQTAIFVGRAHHNAKRSSLRLLIHCQSARPNHIGRKVK